MTRYLISNWKMNGDRASAAAYVAALSEKLATVPKGLKMVFCPPVGLLESVRQSTPPGSRITLGAQDCHHATHGAFTGEISAAMLKDLGVTYVILGHSERRAMGETDEMVFAKAGAALNAGLTPILCVGEQRAAYDAGKTFETVGKQVELLKSLKSGDYLIAYEPVWAIGSSQTPQMAEISAAHQYIKTVLGSRVPVLYGGSVNVGNIGEILALREVSGALIGGASLENEQMAAMIDIASKK